MRRESHLYFKSYCQNLQRLGLAELIDEHRRQAEMRAWRASLIGMPVQIAGSGQALSGSAG